mgnify:CR=1 FL=1
MNVLTRIRFYLIFIIVNVYSKYFNSVKANQFDSSNYFIESNQYHDENQASSKEMIPIPVQVPVQMPVQMSPQVSYPYQYQVCDEQ